MVVCQFHIGSNFIINFIINRAFKFKLIKRLLKLSDNQKTILDEGHK